MRSKIASPTLIKFPTKFYVSDCKKNLSFKNAFQIFLNFWHDLKKWRFDILFDVVRILPLVQPCQPSALLLGLMYCYYRPPEGRRSPVGRPVRCQSTFKSFFGPGPSRVRGWQFSVGCTLSLFQGVLVLLHRSGRFPKSQNSTVFRTYQRQGVVSLNFVKARSNLNGPRFLTDFLDPGSIRVNISLCWGGGWRRAEN